MPKENTKGITKEFLEEHYVSQGKSCSQIGRELGCTRTIVTRAMRKFGLSIKATTEKFFDIQPGMIFNRLIVLEVLEKDKKHRVFCKCQCQCDKKTIKIIEKVNLVNKNVKSCGCLFIEYNDGKKIGRIGDITKEMWESIVRNAVQRNLEINITHQFIWDLFLKQEGKCALSGIKLKMLPDSYKDKKTKTASLDRIDNTKGYTEDNVQWVHKDINRIKFKYSMAEIIYWADQISSFYEKKEFVASDIMLNM